MKFGMLFVLMAGSALFQLGCGSGGGGGSIPTCSASFQGCGGDLTGKWAIDGICLEGDIRSAMSNSEVPAECSDMIKDVSTQMSGTVEFNNGTQTSDVTSSMEMTFKISSSCFSAMSGTSMSMTKEMCDLMGSSMKPDAEDGGTATAKCSFSGGSCNCTMTTSGRDQTSTPYTISGNTFTNEGDTVEYCVSGKTLNTRQRSSSDSSSGMGSQIKFHKI
jgi:hypothetical protein